MLRLSTELPPKMENLMVCKRCEKESHDGERWRGEDATAKQLHLCASSSRRHLILVHVIASSLSFVPPHSSARTTTLLMFQFNFDLGDEVLEEGTAGIPWEPSVDAGSASGEQVKECPCVEISLDELVSMGLLSYGLL
jgi:hypothetical protein